MLLWFDRNGRLLEYLEDGAPARQGSTNFKVFAYVDGITTGGTDGLAAGIVFQKPDIAGRVYPELSMDAATITVVNAPSSSLFRGSNTFKGFLFDFSNFTLDEETITLLDTPGLWRASIRIYNSSRSRIVIGEVTFAVENSAFGDDSETRLDIDDIYSNVAHLLARKLNINSNRYMKVEEDFVSSATNKTLPVDFYNEPGKIVYDKTTTGIYRIDTLIPNPEDESLTGATYTIVGSSGGGADKVDKSSALKVVYATDNVGGQIVLPYSEDPNEGTIAMRTGTGAVLGETDSEENKSYVNLAYIDENTLTAEEAAAILFGEEGE